MTAPADFETIERLLAEATPGPWVSLLGTQVCYVDTTAQLPNEGDNVAVLESARMAQNAALIVAAVNALPALLAEVRAVRAESTPDEVPSAYENGIQQGRINERRDVVAWLRTQHVEIQDPWDYTAALIEAGEHIPEVSDG